MGVSLYLYLSNIYIYIHYIYKLHMLWSVFFLTGVCSVGVLVCRRQLCRSCSTLGSGTECCLRRWHETCTPYVYLYIWNVDLYVHLKPMLFCLKQFPTSLYFRPVDWKAVALGGHMQEHNYFKQLCEILT